MNLLKIHYFLGEDGTMETISVLFPLLNGEVPLVSLQIPYPLLKTQENQIVGRDFSPRPV